MLVRNQTNASSTGNSQAIGNFQQRKKVAVRGSVLSFSVVYLEHNKKVQTRVSLLYHDNTGTSRRLYASESPPQNY